MIRPQAMEFVRRWIRLRQGSAEDLARAIEEEVGWPARHVLNSVLEELRATRDLPAPERKYLFYTLTDEAVAAALAGDAPRSHRHDSELDELFTRSRQFRRSKKFVEAVEFVGRFREYSPFNNMLVYLQNPLSTYFATARRWERAFGRTIKEEARAMIILAPRSPVLLVYDIADTDGTPLPKKLGVFAKVSGPFDPLILERMVKNCAHDGIRVERQAMGRLRAGFATWRQHGGSPKIRISVRADLEPSAACAVLVHELAHVYLGHLGTDRDGWWPYRMNLPEAVMEIEAESVAHIVCRRAGLSTHSAEYLSSYVENAEDLADVSLDLVARAAGRIEEMGRKLLPPRAAG